MLHLFSQPNTFQAALLTDGRFGFAIFNYREQEMLWDTNLLLRKDVIIGYNSADGIFQNAQLESPFTSEDSRYRPDQLIGNTGLQGRWVFRLENNDLSTLNYKGLCLDWYHRQPEPSTWTRTLGVCPCGFDQGRTDTQYGRGENSRDQNARVANTRASNSNVDTARRLDPALLDAISDLQGKLVKEMFLNISIIYGLSPYIGSGKR